MNNSEFFRKYSDIITEAELNDKEKAANREWNARSDVSGIQDRGGYETMNWPDKYQGEPEDNGEYFNSTVAEIAEMTQNNDHNGALLLACELLGQRFIAEKVQKMIYKHQYRGYKDEAMNEDWHEIYNEMINIAKRHLSGEKFNQIADAF